MTWRVRRQLLNLVMRMVGGKFRSHNQLFMLGSMASVAFDEIKMKVLHTEEMECCDCVIAWY